jgi:multisubunit Na+/H+ antiporter MnhG subunit
VFVFRWLRNFVTRRITQLANRPALIPLLVVAVIGVLAFWLAPDVSSRKDADDLSAVFTASLATTGVIFIGLVAAQVAVNDEAVTCYLTVTSYVLMALGIAASLGGLIVSLPLGLFRYAFAISVAGFVVAVVMVIVVASVHRSQTRKRFIRRGGNAP